MTSQNQNSKSCHDRMLPVSESKLEDTRDYHRAVSYLHSWVTLMTREEYRGMLLIKKLENMIDKDNQS